MGLVMVANHIFKDLNLNFENQKERTCQDSSKEVSTKLS